MSAMKNFQNFSTTIGLISSIFHDFYIRGKSSPIDMNGRFNVDHNVATHCVAGTFLRRTRTRSSFLGMPAWLSSSDSLVESPPEISLVP